MALFRTLPTPTNDLLPSLMMEVCLVLAPDVNFFLNSRKQGLPCWRSLSVTSPNGCILFTFVATLRCPGGRRRAPCVAKMATRGMLTDQPASPNGNTRNAHRPPRVAIFMLIHLNSCMK